MKTYQITNYKDENLEYRINYLQEKNKFNYDKFKNTCLKNRLKRKKKNGK